MVTGYHIEIGYQSAGETTFEQIVEVVKYIINEKFDEFKAKCIEYGLSEKFNCEYNCTLDQFLERYKEFPTENDSTCVISNPFKHKDGTEISFAIRQKAHEYGLKPQIMQLVGLMGGHSNERHKICKAFSILVLDECFKRGLSVSLHIA